MLQDGEGGGTLVCWVDQFNKARDSRTPVRGRDI